MGLRRAYNARIARVHVVGCPTWLVRYGQSARYGGTTARSGIQTPTAPYFESRCILPREKYFVASAVVIMPFLLILSNFFSPYDMNSSLEIVPS
jgi:hypothetical protein